MQRKTMKIIRTEKVKNKVERINEQELIQKEEKNGSDIY